MGVLYYMRREGDRELFALNKTPRSVPALMRDFEEWREPWSEEEALAAFREFFPGGERDDRARWLRARIAEWAEGRRVLVTSENDEMFFDGTYSDWEDERAHITGSAYRADYEGDGVTYRRRSAW